jgi:L-lactate dehydrogenase complex protein LldE
VRIRLPSPFYIDASSEEVVSTKMGYDKVSDRARAGAEYIASADGTCLMHQQGYARRTCVPIEFIHIAQI